MKEYQEILDEIRRLTHSKEDSQQQKKSIEKLLALEEEDAWFLHQEAGKMRDARFNKGIFVYGFVYFSTYCRNDCNFCYYRKSNEIHRYRKTPEEILEAARGLARSGVHLIDLTMGEDPAYGQDDFQVMQEITEKIKKEIGLPVMISPGVLSKNQLEEFRQRGADWYALYQETHNQELFQRLRWDQSYEERMEAKEYARSTGWLMEEGILTGVGESLSDIADSLMEMGKIQADQMRVMSFVPQKGSPMEAFPLSDSRLELNIIAILRLLYPNVLIPASLDVEGIGGLKSRILAGANVVTSIIPPQSGLAGVAQTEMDVDEGGRTVEEVSRILGDMGLRCASQEEYQEYLRNKRNA